MLLNRRRINRWAKIAAGTLAFIFAFTFVTAGVGSGLNVNWLDLWRSIGGSSNNSSSSGSQSPEDRLKGYEATLKTEPNNYEALLGAANENGTLGKTALEAQYLERAVKVKESADLYKRLAAIYATANPRDDQAIVRVLNEATSLNPADADSFLQLGAAQRNLGNNSAAILAWNRYLELAPEGDMAATVKEQLTQLTPASTTATTAGATTTTTAK